MEFFTHKKLKANARVAIREAVANAVGDNSISLRIYNYLHPNEDKISLTDDEHTNIVQTLTELEDQFLNAIEITPKRKFTINYCNLVVAYEPFPTICAVVVNISFYGFISFGSQR